MFIIPGDERKKRKQDPLKEGAYTKPGAKKIRRDISLDEQEESDSYRRVIEKPVKNPELRKLGSDSRRREFVKDFGEPQRRVVEEPNRRVTTREEKLRRVETAKGRIQEKTDNKTKVLSSEGSETSR